MSLDPSKSTAPIAVHGPSSQRAQESRSAPAAVPIGNAVAVVSGKGGVGKTNLVANLAVATARLGARVLVVDGDLGLANVDVLLGLVPARTSGDLLDGACGWQEAIIDGPEGIRLLPAATARSELAALSDAEVQAFARGLSECASTSDLCLVDAGAGIGPTVVELALACGRIVLMTTPEPTSLADAYATLKVLWRRQPRRRFEVVINSVRDEREARVSFEHLRRLAARFLEIEIEWLGFLPRDPRLIEAVAAQRAVVELHPSAPASKRLIGLAQRLLTEPEPQPEDGPKDETRGAPHDKSERVASWRRWSQP